MDFQTYQSMTAALQAGIATPEQQREAFAYIARLKNQHASDLRDAERDARDAYHEGRSSAAAEERGEPYGTY